MPHHHILNRNPMTGNARLSSGHVRSHFDMLPKYLLHTPPLSSNSQLEHSL